MLICLYASIPWGGGGGGEVDSLHKRLERLVGVMSEEGRAVVDFVDMKNTKYTRGGGKERIGKGLW